MVAVGIHMQVQDDPEWARWEIRSEGRVDEAGRAYQVVEIGRFPGDRVVFYLTPGQYETFRRAIADALGLVVPEGEGHRLAGRTG